MSERRREQLRRVDVDGGKRYGDAHFPGHVQK